MNVYFLILRLWTGMQKSLDLLFSKKSGYCFLKNLNCIDDSDGVQSTFFWGESIQQCRVGMLCVYLLAPDSARKLKKESKGHYSVDYHHLRSTVQTGKELLPCLLHFSLQSRKDSQ